MCGSCGRWGQVEMSEDRDLVLDNLKGVLIFLVVLGHFLLVYVDTGVASVHVQAAYYYIYSFHMPLFVFISGYFSKDLQKARDTAVPRILIPYLLFNTAMLVFLYSCGRRGMSLLSPQYVYWYLLALFVWRLMLKDLVRIRFLFILSVLASLSTGFFREIDNVFALSRIINFLPFFLLGYYADTRWISQVRSTRKLLAVVGLVLSFLCIYYLTGTGILSTAIFTTAPYRSLTDFYLRPVFYLCATVTGMSMVILCPSRRLPLITAAGESTVVIYVLHRYLSFMINRMIPADNWNDLYALVMVILSVITVALLGHPFLRYAYGKCLTALGVALQEGRTGAGVSRQKSLVLGAIVLIEIPVIAYVLLGPGTTAPTESHHDGVLHRVMSKSIQDKLASSITISFVGDLILLEDGVKHAWNPRTKDYDFAPVFSHVKHYLQQSDYCIGVLEVPVAGEDAGYSQSNFGDGIPLYLNALNQWARDIQAAGIDLVTTANNHALDKGVEGLFRTLDSLDAMGMHHIGTYRNAQERESAFVVTIRGVKVAFIAYTYGVNYYPHSYFDQDHDYLIGILASPGDRTRFRKSRQMLVRDIERARIHDPDLIIALPHMGTQFSHAPDRFSTVWADIMFEEGVDIVLAAHAHAVQPMEIKTVRTRHGKQKEVFVLYCPGNFVNSYVEHNGDAAAIVTIHLEASGPRKGQLIAASIVPMWIRSLVDCQYAPLPIYDAVTNPEIRRTLSRLEFDRIRSVQEIITTTMLGFNITLDQLQSRYYMDRHGYMRQPLSIEITEELCQIPLDANRERLRNVLTNAQRIMVLGDSISEGTKNGGYPWFEPLTSIFADNTFINKSRGGETSVTLLSRMNYVLEEPADVFLAAVGANDVRYRKKASCAMTACEFIRTMDAITKKIVARNPDAHIVFVSAWPAYHNDIYSALDSRDRDEMIDAYNQALEHYCVSNGLIFVDATVHIRCFLKTRVTADYLLDHIHPNARHGIKVYSNAVLCGEYEKWIID